MEITDETLEGNVAVVTLVGRLDAGAVAATEKHIQGVLAKGPRLVVLDLAGLSFISSAGLRVLLTTAKLLKAKGGKLALCAVQRYVKEVFDLSGFSTIFPLCATRQDALSL